MSLCGNVWIKYTLLIPGDVFWWQKSLFDAIFAVIYLFKIDFSGGLTYSQFYA